MDATSGPRPPGSSSRTDRLNSFERLEIYNRQYWFRLLDCLYDDYPGLLAVLGERKFLKFAIAYLARYPSNSFALRDLGARLETIPPRGTALERRPARNWPWIWFAFEWAQVVAFDALAKPPITTDEILDTPPGDAATGASALCQSAPPSLRGGRFSHRAQKASHRRLARRSEQRRRIGSESVFTQEEDAPASSRQTFISPCTGTTTGSISSASNRKLTLSLPPCSDGLTVENACLEAIDSGERPEEDWAPKIQAGFRTGLLWAGSAAQNEQPLSIRPPRFTRGWSAGANYLQAPLLLFLRVYFLLAALPRGQRASSSTSSARRSFSAVSISRCPWSTPISPAPPNVLEVCCWSSASPRALVAIPVAFTMIVAYVTADSEALTSIFSDPDKFVAAAPFPFLLTALLVLAFGPGTLSLDALIKRMAPRERVRSHVFARHPPAGSRVTPIRPGARGRGRRMASVVGSGSSSAPRRKSVLCFSILELSGATGVT